eukprot:1182742-Prorocentrum_minimum.AAC.14
MSGSRASSPTSDSTDVPPSAQLLPRRRLVLLSTGGGGGRGRADAGKASVVARPASGPPPLPAARRSPVASKRMFPHPSREWRAQESIHSRTPPGTTAALHLPSAKGGPQGVSRGSGGGPAHPRAIPPEVDRRRRRLRAVARLHLTGVPSSGAGYRGTIERGSGWTSLRRSRSTTWTRQGQAAVTQ